MTAPDEHLPTEIFHVNANSELRIEVGEAQCYITVTNGTAEVFGAVLQSHRRIELQHSKVAIFSWEGCSISLEGFPSEPACAPPPPPPPRSTSVPAASARARRAGTSRTRRP